jgi:hypothetical protein
MALLALSSGCATLDSAVEVDHEVVLGEVDLAGRRQNIVLAESGRLLRAPLDATRDAPAEGVETTEATHLEDRHVGIELIDLPGDVASALYGERSAVVVGGCILGGPAHRAGVRRGDRLRSLQGESPADARSAVARLAALRGGDTVTLEVAGPLGPLSATMIAEEDLERDFEMSIPLVVRTSRSTQKSEFRLVAGLLHHREAEFLPSATREPAVAVTFGLVLNLFRMEISPRQTELRLLWLIPIRW